LPIGIPGARGLPRRAIPPPTRAVPPPPPADATNPPRRPGIHEDDRTDPVFRSSKIPDKSYSTPDRFEVSDRGLGIPPELQLFQQQGTRPMKPRSDRTNRTT